MFFDVSKMSTSEPDAYASEPETVLYRVSKVFLSVK